MPTVVTKADVMAARTCIAKCREVDEEIARHKSIGLECPEDEARCDHLRKTMEQFVAVWGPILGLQSKSSI